MVVRGKKRYTENTEDAEKRIARQGNFFGVGRGVGQGYFACKAGGVGSNPTWLRSCRVLKSTRHRRSEAHWLERLRSLAECSRPAVLSGSFVVVEAKSDEQQFGLVFFENGGAREGFG